MVARASRRQMLTQLKSIHENEKDLDFPNEVDRQTYLDIQNGIATIFDISLGHEEKYTHTPVDKNDNREINAAAEGYLSVYGQNTVQFISKFADIYFSQEKYRTPEIDWFYTDMLVLAAKQVNKEKLRNEPLETAFPDLSAIVDQFVEKGFLFILLRLLWFILKWTLFIAILIALVLSAFTYPIAGVAAAGLIGYNVYNFSRKRNMWNKIALRGNRLFDRMDSTYNLLEQIQYDRALLKDDLSYWRQTGLYVPGPLWSACKQLEIHN